jgi:thymidylate kinase
MWKIISKPDILIFLDVEYETTLSRKKLNWNQQEYAEQQYRLRHARQHAHLVIHTDALTTDQVLEQTLDFLHSLK